MGDSDHEQFTLQLSGDLQGRRQRLLDLTRHFEGTNQTTTWMLSRDDIRELLMVLLRESIRSGQLMEFRWKERRITHRLDPKEILLMFRGG